MPRALVKQLLVFSRTASQKGLDVEGDWKCGWHHFTDAEGGPRLHKMRKEKFMDYHHLFLCFLGHA